MIANCLLRMRKTDETMFIQSEIDPNAFIINMNGYAIIPIEEYEELKKNKYGFDLLDIKSKLYGTRKKSQTPKPNIPPTPRPINNKRRKINEHI